MTVCRAGRIHPCVFRRGRPQTPAAKQNAPVNSGRPPRASASARTALATSGEVTLLGGTLPLLLHLGQQRASPDLGAHPRIAARLIVCCDVDRCPDNPGRAMAIFVRCIHNTLAADVLVVGEIYEVMHINERDGYYALSGLGRFTMTRFKLVSAAEAGYWPSRRRRSPAGEEPNPS